MENKISPETEIDEINQRLWTIRYDDPAKSMSEATLMLARAVKSGYEKGIAYAKLNIAACSFLQSKNDKALTNLSEALLWLTENPSEPGYSIALNLKGNLFESFGEYEKALQYCLQAHKLSIVSNDRETEAEVCSQLGMIYTRLYNFKKALDHYNEALEIREELKDENAMASSLNRIGMIMRLNRKFEESLEYYYRSLEIRRRNNQITSIPWTMLGIASTLEEMHKTGEALEYYEKGMTGGDIRCTLQCILGSGRIYSQIGNRDKAEEKLTGSLQFARELKAKSLEAEAYLALANHYESTGDAVKALRNHKLHHKIKETVQSDEAQNRLRNIEISHAVEKSEQEKEIFRLRHVELKKAYDIIEDKNKDITASISYASRIQRAMLPDPAAIKGLNTNSFILFLPKDIVSGDFYWLNKTGDKLIVVAADCTGHGVPGAMMSMLGISFLEEIVISRKISDSGLILDELRKEILRALHQKSNSQETKDGMDINLCIIDDTKKTVQYSGAFNNLYLIRNNELTEFRADRMPIGLSDLIDKNFSSQTIPYIPGDIIYLFSDGYADQFGGPENKKFKYLSLKNLLTEIHTLPLINQKIILEKRFYDWKDECVQTDDVLIIGLRL